MTTLANYMTLGEIAEETGYPLWKVQRLYTLKKLPEPERVGRARVVRRSELAKVREALRAQYGPGRNGK